MARLANFEQGKSATVAGSYDSFEQDYDLADTDCELTVAEEDEEEAVVEKDSDLARAVSELKFATQRGGEEIAGRGDNVSDPGKEEGEESIASRTSEEGADDDFHCNPIRQLCLSDRAGSLSGRGGEGTPEIKGAFEEMRSVRVLMLRMQPQSVEKEFAEQAREVA